MKAWYERYVLPHLIHWVMREPRLRPYRERVVGRAHGTVLEIGIGSAHNASRYGAQVRRVVGVDPAAPLLRLARRALDNTPRHPPTALHLATADALPYRDGAFDTAVMTWTLCSLPDPGRALGEVRRVLKPGGMLRFVEHGLAPDRGVQAWQRRLTPLWRPLAGGCHLDRPIAQLLTAAGFRLQDVQAAYGPGPRLLSYMVEGAAVSG